MIEPYVFGFDDAPVIGIILELERRAPRVFSNAESDERHARLKYWIDGDPDLRDLLDRALAAQTAVYGGDGL